MTCEHINRAKIKLNSLVERLNNTSSRVYETWTYVDPDNIKSRLESSGIIFKDYTAKTNWTNSDKKIINKGVLKEYLNDLERELNCGCFSSANSRVDTLSEAHREERMNMRSQMTEIKDQYKEIVDNQSSLIKDKERENSIIIKENSDLQRTLGLSEGQARQLEIRLADKSNALEVSQQTLERLKKVFQDLLVSDATNAERARIMGEQLDWTKGRVEFSDTRILELENRLNQKQQQLEEINNSLTFLRIEYRTETSEKDNKLRQKEEQIKNLKGQLGNLQEKFSSEREHVKEGSLEEFAIQLGISLQQISNLRKHYERLIDARKNYNHDNIETHERSIMEIKQEIVNEGVCIVDIQKVCRKCEKLAELRNELEKTRQEQYEAGQEHQNHHY